jgi:recombination protein RecA
MADERQKALSATLTELTKRFGDGAVVRLGDAEHLDVEAISSGVLSLDVALGVGGFPRGRVIEIYGPESSGKTTLCLHLIAEAQKQGGVAGFIDMEHALDPHYAERLGVDVNGLYVAQPDTAEQALEIVEMLARSGAFYVLVLDSVAALVPKAEIEGEMGDSHMGLQARLMSQALRKLSGVLKQTNTILVFTNQLREKIGVLFGSPETQPGGRALRFYASVRLDIRRLQGLRNGETDVGSHVRARVVKNKVAPPFREAEFDIYFDTGISRLADLVDLGIAHEILDKRGALLRYQDQLIGQGREAARAFLAENQTVAANIEAEIRAKCGLAPKEKRNHHKG